MFNSPPARINTLRHFTAAITAPVITAMEDSTATLGDSAEVIEDSAAALEGTPALGTMESSGVF